ncbi:MAG: VOC family protein [Deltaproteobacteria bacterium]|nr:VOC family protein [Deltaproteobacteria bacterium]
MAENGRFVWHELLTRDFTASRIFYGELLGWVGEALPGYAGTPYSIFRFDGEPVAGVVTLEPNDPRSSAWLGYVAVEDVGAAIRGAAVSGGGILIPPTQLPSIGRVSVLTDPAGAPVAAWRGFGTDIPARASEAFCWDELSVADASRVLPFYQQVFGWSPSPFQAGGWLFSAGGQQVASVMSNPGAPSHWLSHLVIEDLDWARDRVVRLGGRIDLVEQAVPGSGRFAVITDNVGARVALFEPRVGPV